MQGYVGNVLLKNIPRVSSLRVKGWAPEGSSEDAIGKGTLGTDLSVVPGLLAPPLPPSLSLLCDRHVTPSRPLLGPRSILCDHRQGDMTSGALPWSQTAASCLCDLGQARLSLPTLSPNPRPVCKTRLVNINNNSSFFLNAYFVRGAVLNPFHVLTHVISECPCDIVYYKRLVILSCY